MASISKDKDRDGKLNGCRTLQFVNGDGKRKSVRLGKVTQRQADTIRQYVESVLSANFSGDSYDRATAEWISRIGPALHAKFAESGLFAKRKAKGDSALGKFTDRYIETRQTMKPKSVHMLKYARHGLVEYFGANKPLADITEGDADEYRQHLSKTLSENTVRTQCNRARQLFAAAVKHQVIEVNPFGNMTNLKALEVRDRARFIPRETIDKILDQIIDPELKLIVVLARYGGLRVPSEPMAMKWGDIDWARERITVHSIKTERHDGKQVRVIPMFPEIKPHLEAVYNAAPDGTEDVIIRNRSTATTLWRRLDAAVRAAGLETWPKPFHNLRATRETELCETLPQHVVYKWIGNSEAVAAKHYLQVTDEHYERALQKCMQQPAATGCDAGNHQVK